MESKIGADYSDRRYLSAGEAARYLGTTVRELHRMVREENLPMTISGSGQQRFDLALLGESFEVAQEESVERVSLDLLGTPQGVRCRSSAEMSDLEDGSINLAVTSPPYFNTKMYSPRSIEGDLGNVHSFDEWFP